MTYSTSNDSEIGTESSIDAANEPKLVGGPGGKADWCTKITGYITSCGYATKCPKFQIVEFKGSLPWHMLLADFRCHIIAAIEVNAESETCDLKETEWKPLAHIDLRNEYGDAGHLERIAETLFDDNGIDEEPYIWGDCSPDANHDIYQSTLIFVPPFYASAAMYRHASTFDYLNEKLAPITRHRNVIGAIVIMTPDDDLYT